MPTFKVARKAYSDLVAIGRFTEKEWGKAQRITYLKQIDECFLQIARNPEIGTSCDFIRTGYRKFPQASHLIFYRQDAVGVIEIIRVLHRSMDVESKLSRA